MSLPLTGAPGSSVFPATLYQPVNPTPPSGTAVGSPRTWTCHRNLPETLFERAVGLLRELTAISSDSGDPAGLRRTAERLAAALRERGLTVEMREEEGDLPCCSRPWTGDLSRASPADRPSRYRPPPAMKPQLDGDRLVATGAIDMKGGFAALLGALDLLRSRAAAAGRPAAGGRAGRGGGRRAVAGRRPPLGGGCPGSVGAGAGRARPRDGRRRDPGGGPAGDGAVASGGSGTAAHSGLHYWEGRSALVPRPAGCGG